MVEKSNPELIPYLSTCKSPQMMLGAVIKNYFSAVRVCAHARVFCSVPVCVCVCKRVFLCVCVAWQGLNEGRTMSTKSSSCSQRQPLGI